jgi:hypothetical protein
MSNENDDRIRERAHAIWAAQGHPEGLADEHWAQAEAEIAALDVTAPGEAVELPNPLATGAAAEELAKPKRRKKTL